jgi:hypothetical protein
VISSPFVIILSGTEKAVLAVRAASARAEHREVVRAGSCWPPRKASPTP